MVKDTSLPALNIPAILRKYGLHPDKSLGQNFLMDEAALRRVVQAAEIGAGEAVLEIGPGLGSLTRHLSNAAQRVVAVEIDEKLIPPLQEILAPFDNVQIIHGDILEINPDELFPTDDYLVVANIPYYITSAIIRHLLEARQQPRRLILTVQREVAQRICAPPGQLSLLALSVQVYGAARIAARIPAGAFYPAPKVDSAVVRIDLLEKPKIPPALLPTFFRAAKAGFSQKRKTLRNSLSAGMAWPKETADQILTHACIDPQRRAETLDLDEWRALVIAITEEQGSSCPS